MSENVDVLALYQAFTPTTAIYPEERELEYLALGLASESGEVAGKVKKLIRDGKINRNEIAVELGDVLWYVSQICNHFDLSLHGVIRGNIKKLAGRKDRGTIGGEGDYR